MQLMQIKSNIIIVTSALTTCIVHNYDNIISDHTT